MGVWVDILDHVGVAVNRMLVPLEDWLGMDITVNTLDDWIFQTEHWPVFCLIQLAFVFVFLKHHAPIMRGTKTLFVGLGMSYFGRLCVGYLTGRPDALFVRPWYVPAGIAMWMLVNLFPCDLVFAVLRSPPCYALLQLGYTFVQARDVTYGVRVGLDDGKGPWIGGLIDAMLLSGLDGLIWLGVGGGGREFGNDGILRQLAGAALTIVLTRKPEWFAPLDTRPGTIPFYVWALFAASALWSAVIWGIRGREGIFSKSAAAAGWILRYNAH